MATDKPRIAHVTTVDLTHRFLLLGQLKRLQEEGFEVTAISARGRWSEAGHIDGIPHVRWPHATRAWRPLSDVRAFFALRRILREGDFDLVHTHNPKPGVLGRIAARRAKVPCIVNTVHGLYTTPDDRAMRRRAILALERIAASVSDLEMYQSREDLDWARSLGIVDETRSILLGNGVDLTSFDPASIHPERRKELRAQMGVGENEILVGSVGRLVGEKGYRELFAAAREVRSRRPAARFAVVGEFDPDKVDSISEEEKTRAAGDVFFAGWRSDVRDLLAAFDIFVLPSWREGVPRSAIEAGAMALPLVVTDIRGCREIVRNEVEGLLVPPRDPAALARAIERLVEDPEARRVMGAAARSRIESEFDERRVLDTVVSSYRTLLTRKGILFETNDSVAVRRARRGDTASLARLHADALPDAFLSSLGLGFLETLYHAMVDSAGAVVLVAEEPGSTELLGFVAGVASVPDFYRRFYRRHGLRAALRSWRRVVRPSAFRRVFETSRHPVKDEDLPSSELLALGVGRSARGRGVGTELVRRFLQDLADEGVGLVRVVVAADNDPANRLYEAARFEKATTIEVHRGVPSNVLVTTCPSPSHSSSRSP